MTKQVDAKEYYELIRNLGADAQMSPEAIADMRERGATASDAEIRLAFQQFVARVKTQSFEEFRTALAAAPKRKSSRLAVEGAGLRAGWPSGGQMNPGAGVDIFDAIWGSIGYLW